MTQPYFGAFDNLSAIVFPSGRVQILVEIKTVTDFHQTETAGPVLLDIYAAATSVIYVIEVDGLPVNYPDSGYRVSGGGDGYSGSAPVGHPLICVNLNGFTDNPFTSGFFAIAEGEVVIWADGLTISDVIDIFNGPPYNYNAVLIDTIATGAWELIQTTTDIDEVTVEEEFSVTFSNTIAIPRDYSVIEGFTGTFPPALPAGLHGMLITGTAYTYVLSGESSTYGYEEYAGTYAVTDELNPLYNQTRALGLPYNGVTYSQILEETV